MKLHRHPLILCLLIACCALSGCGPNPEGLVGSAKSYLAKDDQNAAIIQLKTALQKNPNHAEARFLLGQALLITGDANGAAVELQRALDLNHPAAAVVPPLAHALLAEGQAKKVVDQYAALDLPDPAAAADLKTSLSVAYSRLGNSKQADDAVAAALKAVPDFPPALIMQARLLVRRGDTDGALQMLDKVLQRYPGEAEAWQLKGDLLYLGKGDSVAGLAAYRQALGVRKDLLPAHTAIISLFLAKNDTAGAQTELDGLRKVFPNHPQTKYFEALLALRRHDLVTARELAQLLLRAAPDYSRALRLAGSVEYERGAFGQAEKYLSQSLQKVPNDLMARRLLAQTYLRSGQPAKALATLLPVVDTGAQDAEALAQVAEAYLQNGEMGKAAEYYARAAKLNPKDVKSRTALALTHMWSGDSEVGFNELEGIALADAGSTADLALISARFQRNELDSALKAVDGLERKQPDKPLAPSLRGKIQLARHDVAGARKSFERALAVDPVYFPAVDSLAALDLAEGKPQDARARFEKLLEVEPSNYKALLAIAGLRTMAGGSKEEVAELINKAVKLNPSEAAPRLILIDQYIKRNDLKLAMSAAQDAVAALPDNPQVLEALGRVQLASAELNQAITSFSRLAAMLPQSPQPQLMLADVYVASKNVDMAEQSLKRALSIAPDSLQAQRNLVALEVAAGRSKEALALARSMQKQHPNESIGYLFEGDIEAATKDFDGAANAYRAGLARRKASALAVKLHAVLLAAGRKAEADKFAAGWLKDSPKDAGFLFHLGDVALAAGDFALAEAHYLGVVQIRPDDAPALNNIAWLESKLKKKGALGYAERANTSQPNQPMFMDTLATILAENGQVERALTVQRKALEIQPQNPTLRLTLAKLYVKAGDKAKAKDELEELAKIGPRFGGYEEVNQLLKAQ